MRIKLEPFMFLSDVFDRVCFQNVRARYMMFFMTIETTSSLG